MENTGTYLLKKNRVRIEDTVLTVLTEQYESDDVSGYPLHSHRYTEVFFSADAAFSICTEREPVAVEHGAAVIIPKGIPHHISVCNSDTVKEFGVILEQAEDGGGDRRIYEAFNAVFGVGDIRILPAGEPLFSLIGQLLNTEDDVTTLLTAVRLFEEVKNCCCIPAAERASVPVLTVSERLIMLDSILNAWFNRPLNAKTVASMLYISERQLSRIIAENCGTTLQRMISERRVSAAKSLLAESICPVDEIGCEVGFRSRSGFYDEFRKQTGMTPAAFRASARKQGKDERSGVS